METEERDLSSILKRVQQFINMAEGSNNNAPDSPEWHALNTEQGLARERADALMLRYAITEAMAEAAKPAAERMRPVVDVFQGGSGDLSSYVDRIATIVADFTRTKVRYYRYDQAEHVSTYKVYGYESDVRYFTFLYTTLRLHFIGALHPKIDPTLSQDENSYILHNAGFGWHDIAEMYGWTKKMVWDPYQYKDVETWYTPTGELWTDDLRTMVRPYRSGCLRECKRRGEEMVKHVRPEAFRSAAAQGYLSRIRKRLYDVEQKRIMEGSSTLALRIDDVDQFIREEMGTCTRCPACQKLSITDWRCDLCGNTEGMPGQEPEAYVPCPKCDASKRGYCNEHSNHGMYRSYSRKYSEAGYQAGVRQANSADLGGQRTGSSQTRSIN